MTRWNALHLAPVLIFVMPTSAAEQPHSAARVLPQIGPLGGQIHQIGEFQCETVFSSKSVQVYVFDRAGEPLSTKNVRGRATFKLPSDPRKYHYDLYPQTGDGVPANGLHLVIDLSQVPDRSAVVEFVIYGIAQQPPVFATQFQRSLTTEQIAIRLQGICPVSGEPLGSMGQPPKVRIGVQEIFVCCKGCIKKVKEQPDKYLNKMAALRNDASQPLRR